MAAMIRAYSYDVDFQRDIQPGEAERVKPLDQILAIVPSNVVKAADGLGVTPMQVALAWLLRRSPNILLIPGIILALIAVIALVVAIGYAVILAALVAQEAGAEVAAAGVASPTSHRASSSSSVTRCVMMNDGSISPFWMRSSSALPSGVACSSH